MGGEEYPRFFSPGNRNVDRLTKSVERELTLGLKVRPAVGYPPSNLADSAPLVNLLLLPFVQVEQAYSRL